MTGSHCSRPYGANAKRSGSVSRSAALLRQISSAFITCVRQLPSVMIRSKKPIAHSDDRTRITPALSCGLASVACLYPSAVKKGALSAPYVTSAEGASEARAPSPSKNGSILRSSRSTKAS